MNKTLYEKLTDAGRTGIGTTLQVASFHPALNIPYVGTGIGGALFEVGSAIKDKKPAKEVLKDAGRGFIIGETVGAIPYVGKGLNRATGGRIGNVLDDAGRYIANTKVGQTVGNYAQSAGNAINKGLESAEDFINTKLRNKQIVYHGSPKDFNKFDNAYIGTGEGAQAHGYGHYTAKNKDVADKRYRERLAEDSFDNVEIYSKEFDETVKEPFDVAQYLFGVKNNPEEYQKALNRAQKRQNDIIESLEYSKKMQEQDPFNYIPNTEYDNKLREELGRINTALMYLDDIDNFDIKFNYKNPGQLYKLSIPKDDVMLREYASFSEQPKAVQRGLEQIREKAIKEKGYNSIDEVRERLNAISDEYEKKIREQAVPFWAWGSTPISDYQIELSKLERLNNMFDYGGSSKDIYKNLSKQLGKEEASSLLNQHGIKGISYNGGIDGEANVIFNPNEIEIVRKYYNQPLLSEKIMDNINWGTGVNALYDYLMDK